MSSLSTSQRLVLTIAAQRAHGTVLPLPEGLSVRGRARQLMLEGLIRRGLIAERPAQHGEPAWAQGDGNFALQITAEGRALVGSIDEEPSSRDDQPPEPASPRADANAPDPEPSNARLRVRPGTKQGLLIGLLRRPSEGKSRVINTPTATASRISHDHGASYPQGRAADQSLRLCLESVRDAPSGQGLHSSLARGGHVLRAAPRR